MLKTGLGIILGIGLCIQQVNASEDSLRVHELISNFESILYTDPGKAREYVDEALDLAQNIDYQSGVGTGFKNLGVLFQYAGDYDSARFYYLQAGRIFHALGDSLQLTSVLANTASAYYDQGNYDASLHFIDSARTYTGPQGFEDVMAFLDNTEGSIYLFKGYYVLASSLKNKVADYYSETNNRMRWADAQRDLGLIYGEQKEREKALASYREAEAEYRKLDDRMFLGEIHINMGNEYLEMGSYDSARYYLESGMILCRETGFENLIPIALESEGRLNHKEGRSSQGMYQLEEALTMVQEMEDRYQEASIRNNIAEIHIDREEYDEALHQLNISELFAREIKSLDLLQTVYHLQFAAYRGLGTLSPAIEKYQAYSAVRDTLLNEEKSRQLAEFEILYDLKHKERSLKMQQVEIDLLQRANAIQSQQKLLLAAFAGLLILFAGIVVQTLRNRIRRNRILHEATEREQARELEFKKRELASYALHLAQKNQLLEELKEQIAVLESKSNGVPALQSLRSRINFNSQLDRDWETFKKHFEEVHPQFFKELQYRYPQLSASDLRMLALLKLNLNSKEIATILHISPESVKKSRYRLRKKMELDEEGNLSVVLNEYSY